MPGPVAGTSVLPGLMAGIPCLPGPMAGLVLRQRSLRGATLTLIGEG